MSEPNPFATQGAGSGGPGANVGRAKTPSPPRPAQAHEPAWLKGTGGAQQQAPAAAQHQQVPVQPAAMLQQQQQQPPPPPSGQVPQLVTYMRVANFALCILMCVAAILTVIVPAGATPASWVLAFYVLAFSCLLCCFEFNLRQVAKHIANNFGFLYDAKSRAGFLVFVGVLCFSLGITGKIAGACMIANAIFNTVVLCKYPEYAKFRPESAEQSAASFLRRNPQMAQKAAGAMFSAASSGGGNNQQGGGGSWI